MALLRIQCNLAGIASLTDKIYPLSLPFPTSFPFPLRMVEFCRANSVSIIQLPYIVLFCIHSRSLRCTAFVRVAGSASVPATPLTQNIKDSEDYKRAVEGQENLQPLPNLNNKAEVFDKSDDPLLSSASNAKPVQVPTSKSLDYYVEGLLSRTIWALGEKIFPTIGEMHEPPFHV